MLKSSRCKQSAAAYWSAMAATMHTTVCSFSNALTDRGHNLILMALISNPQTSVSSVELTHPSIGFCSSLGSELQWPGFRTSTTFRSTACPLQFLIRAVALSARLWACSRVWCCSCMQHLTIKESPACISRAKTNMAIRSIGCRLRCLTLGACVQHTSKPKSQNCEACSTTLAVRAKAGAILFSSLLKIQSNHEASRETVLSRMMNSHKLPPVRCSHVQCTVAFAGHKLCGQTKPAMPSEDPKDEHTTR